MHVCTCSDQSIVTKLTIYYVESILHHFQFPLSLSRSNNRIVVMSIHQPRYSIYKLFDTITLLSQGSMVYHGPAEDKAVQYFTRAGKQANSMWECAWVCVCVSVSVYVHVCVYVYMYVNICWHLHSPE